MKDARVMIVEDDDEVAQMVALFFGARSCQVTVASDGYSALRLAREALPSVILLDVGLPDIDGYELYKQFRQNVRTRYIPVIFLTRRSKKADRIAGLELGADDFITKPFDLEELYLRVQNAVTRADREHVSDPHTGLPAGQVVRDAVAAARARPDRAVLEFHLRHADEFRDLYGAVAGLDLLRYTALLIDRVLSAVGAPDDFLGQTAEETFVVITAPERAGLIHQHVLERFDDNAVQHYALGERRGDRVKVRDSFGQELVLPMISLEAPPPT